MPSSIPPPRSDLPASSDFRWWVDDDGEEHIVAVDDVQFEDPEMLGRPGPWLKLTAPARGWQHADRTRPVVRGGV